MLSDDPHFWSDPQLLLQPSRPWEFVKIGNCGSPIETDAGWLVITHGVGPMRKYCIGAMLLDLAGSFKGHRPAQRAAVGTCGAQAGMVRTNVVYTCGALVHGDRLVCLTA